MNNQENTRAADGRAIVYIADHLEFSAIDGLCLAVRDRGTGDFLEDHWALHENLRLAGSLGKRPARLVIRTMGMQISSAYVTSSRPLSSAEYAYLRHQGWSGWRRDHAA